MIPGDPLTRLPPLFPQKGVEPSKMGATKNFQICFHLAHIVPMSVQNDSGRPPDPFFPEKSLSNLKSSVRLRLRACFLIAFKNGSGRPPDPPYQYFKCKGPNPPHTRISLIIGSVLYYILTWPNLTWLSRMWISILNAKALTLHIHGSV